VTADAQREEIIKSVIEEIRQISAVMAATVS